MVRSIGTLKVGLRSQIATVLLGCPRGLGRAEKRSWRPRVQEVRDNRGGLQSYFNRLLDGRREDLRGVILTIGTLRVVAYSSVPVPRQKDRRNPLRRASSNQSALRIGVYYPTWPFQETSVHNYGIGCFLGV
jgi:hypothetical protein